MRRRDTTTPFFHEVNPPDLATRSAIYELYIKNGKLSSVTHEMSEDQLTFQVRMSWDCEESFIDYFTEDNEFISSRNHRISQYTEENGLLSDTVVEE